MIKGDKRVIKGWVFYDWANSVYNLVISSAIFPIFYTSITRSYYLEKMNRTELLPDENVMVDFLGFSISDSVLMSYVLAASFLLVSVLSPILSGIADIAGNKKIFMRFFCYLGAFSSISLYWFNPENIEWGMLSVFLASIGFWNSLVFYNAYLPEIAYPEDHDSISARGFSMGYFGSMILLIVCLIMIQIIGPHATKYSFILVGIWWVGFAQVTFGRLPKNGAKKANEAKVIWGGFKELMRVFKEFQQTKRLKRYLTSFFFFNTGVQTVMLMATIFAAKEIDWEPDGGEVGLIISILLIQILAAIGAYLMSFLSSQLGNLKTLIIIVLCWCGLTLWGYFIKTPHEFYFLAAGVGLVMGGIQALSRSTYSKFLPKANSHASYFSFYDVSEKVGIVFGLFFFGLMENLTGNLRISVLSVLVFFIIGLLLLLTVPNNEESNISLEFQDF